MIKCLLQSVISTFYLLKNKVKTNDTTYAYNEGVIFVIINIIMLWI